MCCRQYASAARPRLGMEYRAHAAVPAASVPTDIGGRSGLQLRPPSFLCDADPLAELGAVALAGAPRRTLAVAATHRKIVGREQLGDPRARAPALVGEYLHRHPLLLVAPVHRKNLLDRRARAPHEARSGQACGSPRSWGVKPARSSRAHRSTPSHPTRPRQSGNSRGTRRRSREWRHGEPRREARSGGELRCARSVVAARRRAARLRRPHRLSPRSASPHAAHASGGRLTVRRCVGEQGSLSSLAASFLAFGPAKRRSRGSGYATPSDQRRRGPSLWLIGHRRTSAKVPGRGRRRCHRFAPQTLRDGA